jgi:hypothetical protein
MSGHFKFAYEEPHWTTPIRNALNQKTSQATACIVQSSSDICALVGYYAALSGKSVPTFRDNLYSLTMPKGKQCQFSNIYSFIQHPTLKHTTLSQFTKIIY